MGECPYHICIDDIFSEVRDRLSEYYNTPYLEYWLTGDSEFADLYLEKVNEYASTPLSDEDEECVQKKGKSLERTIDIWKKKDPTLSFDTTINKIEVYIKKQFKTEEMIQLFDDCIC